MQTESREPGHPDQAVEFLAEDSQVPIEDVARLYEGEMTKLESGAHIRHFLPIFAIRKVRELLRQQRMRARLSVKSGGA